jgi:galactokinase
MKIAHDQDFQLSSLSPLVTARVPGRINLIGEHTDYNGGKVLPFAMDRVIELTLSRDAAPSPWADAVYSVATSSHPGRLELRGSEIDALCARADQTEASTDLRDLLPGDVASSWARYAVGSLVAFWRLAGAARPDTVSARTHIQIDSHLPYGAGISSSAALTTGLIAVLLSSEKLEVDRPRIARAAMRVEHQFAGIRCGLMDQLAVLLCEKDALLLIDFLDLAQADRITTRTVRLHPRLSAYRAVLINTMVKHELGSSPYNERRLSCERGVAQLAQKLGKSHPTPGHFAADREFMRQFAPDGAQDTMIASLARVAFAEDLQTARRLAHAIMEVSRVDAAVDAVQAGDLQQLTTAINASHLSLAHDYEVSCPELDTLRAQTLAVAEELGRARQLASPPILGARMTGGGFGGSTIQLVHETIVPALCARMSERKGPYFESFGIVPEPMVTKLSDGLTLKTPLESPKS